MIARVWQGRSRPGMGKAYYAYLEQTGLKMIPSGGCCFKTCRLR